MVVGGGRRSDRDVDCSGVLFSDTDGLGLGFFFSIIFLHISGILFPVILETVFIFLFFSRLGCCSSSLLLFLELDLGVVWREEDRGGSFLELVGWIESELCGGEIDEADGAFVGGRVFLSFW